VAPEQRAADWDGLSFLRQNGSPQCRLKLMVAMVNATLVAWDELPEEMRFAWST
jgi:hypothetical protein